MSSTEERAALEARWLNLTRVVLPGMASTNTWPIRYDHCFMRVCLDAVLGAPWHAVIARPAIRTMTDAQLAAAVEIAAVIAAEPVRLGPLNERSLQGRAAFKRASGQAARRVGP